MILSILVLVIMGVLVVALTTTSTAAAYMRVGYDGKGKYCDTSSLYGMPVQAPRKDGVNPTAGVWKEQFSISAKLGDLKAGKLYAIDRIEAHGGAQLAVPAMFVRLTHSGFDGCRPGGLICSHLKGDQATYGHEALEFDRHGRNGQHPVFSSDSPLTLWLLATAQVAPLYWVVVCVEVSSGKNGSEDIQAGYATLDDVQTLTTLAPVAGDFFEIQSDRGAAVLKEVAMIGAKVDFATVWNTSDLFNPSKVFVTRNGNNAGCMRTFRDVPLGLTSTMIIELSSHAEAV